MGTTILVVGHGNYGTGIQSSLKLLAGHNDGVEFVDFIEDDNDVTLKNKINNSISRNDNDQVLFICDILGGTPFKVCVEIAYDNDEMEVVAGCNLGAILETVLQKDTMTTKELAKNIIDSSKQTTIRFEKIEGVNITNSSDIEEGI